MGGREGMAVDKTFEVGDSSHRSDVLYRKTLEGLSFTHPPA